MLFGTGNRAGLRPLLCYFLCGFLLFFSAVFVYFFCPILAAKSFAPRFSCPSLSLKIQLRGPFLWPVFGHFFAPFWMQGCARFYHFFVAVFVLFLLPFWHSFWHRFGSKNEPNWGPKWSRNLIFPALWRISHRFFRGCLFTWTKKSRPAVHLAVPVARFFYPVIFWANRLGAGSERQRPTAGPANGWSTSLPAPLTRGLQHIWPIAVFVIFWGSWLGRAITFSGCRLAG